MTEHDFLDGPSSPYDKGGSGVGDKAGKAVRRISQAPGKAADALTENTQAIPGSEEYLSQNKVSRRELFQKVRALAIGIPATIILAKLVEWSGIIGAYQRTTSEDPRKREQNLQKLEVMNLSILSGPQSGGINQFTKDVATIAARSTNDNGQPIDFSNSSTWSSSEIEVYFQGLDRFTNDLQSQEGRGRIRSYINNLNTQYAGEYNGYVDGYEAYLKSNNLFVNGNQETVKGFFTASVDRGGLGYQPDKANLFFDSLNGYRKSSMPRDLKQRINQFNQENQLPQQIP